MNIKPFFSIAAVMVIGLTLTTSCQKDNLEFNPNAGSEASTIPPSLDLNHITATIIRDDEHHFGNVYKYNQFFVSNYAKYWGSNKYDWSNSTHMYDILKYAIKMENNASALLGNTTNKYFALSKFFRAYSSIWLAQRVGGIPMSQAGDINNLLPAFDTQKDVYKNSLQLLEDANTILSALNTSASIASNKIDNGDIFGLTSLQWQKVINTYKLRVLINLSKRADDNADLNIKQQFAAILSNSTKYPIMTGNSDNVVYKYNAAYNQYPLYAVGNVPYNNFANIGKTLLDITTATQDPRTFAFATPAPAQLTAGKKISDFSAYVGADVNLAETTLLSNGSIATTSAYSFFNYNRYFTSSSGANCEPYIFLGYPEMCFNIAEAINRGWTTLGATDAKTWYDNGIKASLSVYGLAQGQTFIVGDLTGKTLGTVNIDVNTFLSNVAYNTTDKNAALTQILTQKYVAFFFNSGWEAFFNYRRTGIPEFRQGGVGIGTTALGNKIPRRWLYPIDEINNNKENYLKAIGSDFSGTESVATDTWLTK
ncbi:SusD/RagB family nutrient-binding outer membrane lipoprotein [Runella sp.]|uniref:SusD/RagB family nutrient-binding outer membrane lipoprotein n=1 Tax=Runella sp. TaxID=1960881 RepID=UPI0030176141